MTRHRFTGGFVLLVLLIFISPIQTLQAQERPEGVDLYDYATSTNVTIGFAGGTVNDFVNQVKTQAEGLNVLIRADVQKVMLPALSLRNITADTALNSLTPLSLEALTVEVDESQEYYIVGPNLGREIESVEVLNVGWFLSAGSENLQENQEKLLSTIEAGQEMLATSSGTMKIYLHEKTGLLFVKGSNEETLLVKRIMQELLDQQQYMRNMKGQRTKPAGDIGPGGAGGAGAGLDDESAK